VDSKALEESAGIGVVVTLEEIERVVCCVCKSLNKKQYI